MTDENKALLSADELAAELGTFLSKEQFTTEPSECWSYGFDNSRKHGDVQAVVFPIKHDDVEKLVHFCNQHAIPLIPRGRGTGTAGGCVPLKAGIVVSFERMNKILSVAPNDRYIVVQPGVTNQQVQDEARRHGFFWPPDPTSAAFCTIGGNLAYNSAGPRAVKHGTPRENTLGLKVVTGEGKTLRTGTKTTKGVVGYDLTRLFIGSEGTLGIVTEATLKLTPLPESVRTIQAFFDTIEDATHAIASLMHQPSLPYTLEFIDGKAIDMIRDYADIDLPGAAAMLMVEVDGASTFVDELATRTEQLLRAMKASSVTAAHNDEEVAALWKTRKALSPALRTIAPKKINEDVVVPVSRIPELIAGLESISDQHQIPIVNFGHAGNGNIHVNLLINPDDPVQAANTDKCLDAVFTLVLKLEGTLSGEHGIGIEKAPYINRELDIESIGYMKDLKRLFDPGNILNPDKI